LTQQLDLERKIIGLVADSYDFYRKALLLRQTIAGDQKELEKQTTSSTAVAALKEFDQKAQRLQGQRPASVVAEVDVAPDKLRPSPRSTATWGPSRA